MYIKSLSFRSTFGSLRILLIVQKPEKKRKIFDMSTGKGKFFLFYFRFVLNFKKKQNMILDFF